MRINFACFYALVFMSIWWWDHLLLPCFLFVNAAAWHPPIHLYLNLLNFLVSTSKQHLLSIWPCIGRKYLSKQEYWMKGSFRARKDATNFNIVEVLTLHFFDGWVVVNVCSQNILWHLLSQDSNYILFSLF